MSIPDQITLAGITIDIVDVPGLVEERKLLGEAQYQKQRIVIDKGAANYDTVAQCLMHEKIHFALYIMNEDDLRNNEKFVDMLAHLLYQAEKTAIHHKGDTNGRQE